MCGSSPKINSTASREIWPTHKATLVPSLSSFERKLWFELTVNGCNLDVRLLVESRAMWCIMCGSSPKINSTASREIWPTHEATLVSLLISRVRRENSATVFWSDLNDCFLWRVVVKSRTDWVCCVAALPNQSHRFVRDFADKQSHSHPFTTTLLWMGQVHWKLQPLSLREPWRGVLRMDRYLSERWNNPYAICRVVLMIMKNRLIDTALPTHHTSIRS